MIGLEYERRENDKILLMDEYAAKIGKRPFEWTSVEIGGFIRYCEGKFEKTGGRKNDTC